MPVLPVLDDNEIFRQLSEIGYLCKQNFVVALIFHPNNQNIRYEEWRIFRASTVTGLVTFTTPGAPSRDPITKTRNGMERTIPSRSFPDSSP